MADIKEEQADADVPQQAVKALSAAHRRALQAGRTLVVVKDGKLIRVTGTKIDVLKDGQFRVKVQGKTKRTRR